MPILYHVFYALVVFSHSRLCFELASRILTKSKLHFFQYPFCAINAFIVHIILQYLNEFSSLHYLFLVLLLFFQLRTLFTTGLLATITVTTGLILHLFVFRAVIVSIFAIANNATIIEIVGSPYYFWLTGILSFIAHNIAIILFNKFVPAKYLKIIEKNSELLYFIAIICIIIVSYMVYNASIYDLSSTATGINIQQIVLPTTFLFLFYISLFILFNIINLHAYKIKATELEDTISKEKHLKEALLNKTKVYAEFNCTKDKLVRLVINEKDFDVKQYESYSSFLEVTSTKYIHEKDQEIKSLISAHKIIESYNNGFFQFEHEYRALRTPIIESADNPYIWHKLLVKSRLDTSTNEVHAICLIQEIHNEKEEKLALKNKAERDPLTGGYNKEAARTYIKKHLKEKSQGTFFMIDLDNFKQANDNFGHAFGDEVLCTIYNDIKSHFRAYDIVARVGGDEFIAFTPDILQHEILKKKAQDICTAVTHTYQTNDNISITVSASIGIAHAPENGLDYDSLFARADKAMYITKKNGKSSFTISPM